MGPTLHLSVHLHTVLEQEGAFGYLGWVSLNCTLPKNIVWVLGWRPKHPYLCAPPARKGVFGYLGWGSLNYTTPKNIVWVLGWRPKHPCLCTPQARKRCFWILGMGVFELRNAKKYCMGSRVAPRAPIPLHTTSQEKVFFLRHTRLANP